MAPKGNTMHSAVSRNQLSITRIGNTRQKMQGLAIFVTKAIKSILAQNHGFYQNCDVNKLAIKSNLMQAICLKFNSFSPLYS
jgi:hypothetical protein